MLTTRTATAADLETLVELAVEAQTDPQRWCAYVSDTADALRAEVAEVEDWERWTSVAELDGRAVGWLLAEPDLEMGRVWWWGPFAADNGWSTISDALLNHARGALPAAITEEEAAVDDGSHLFRAWAETGGLHADTASVSLNRHERRAAMDPRVRPLAPGDHAAVKQLHQAAFPGTHTTPEALVASDDPRLVIEVGGTVLGYIAIEEQADSSGYIDYLAVEPAEQNQGLGRALVEHGSRVLFDAGVSHVHLTVRAENMAARKLYRAVGFEEERILRPYRRGFTLD